VSRERDEARDVVGDGPVHRLVVGPDAFDDAEDVAVVLVEYLASLLGTDVLEARPLQSVVDLDGFAALLEDSTRPVEVTFVYERLEVTVSSQSVVTVRELDGASGD
jgi:hypothetical protein